MSFKDLFIDTIKSEWFLYLTIGYFYGISASYIVNFIEHKLFKKSNKGDK